MVKPDGSARKQLTRHEEDVEGRWPAWTPDGRHILYGLYEDTDYVASRVIDLDGRVQDEVRLGG